MHLLFWDIPAVFWFLLVDISVMSEYFSFPLRRYVNLMILAVRVIRLLCIDYMVTLPIHLHAGCCSTQLGLHCRDNHAGEKLLSFPQGSTPEVCLFLKTSSLNKLLCHLFGTVELLLLLSLLLKLQYHPSAIQRLRELETARQHYAPVCVLN